MSIEIDSRLGMGNEIKINGTPIAAYVESVKANNLELSRLHAQIHELIKQNWHLREARDFWKQLYADTFKDMTGKVAD